MPHFIPSHLSSANVASTPDLRSVGSGTSALEEMAHELRQPLSVIENLAYYLEMTLTDETAAPHLRRIQKLVMQANRVLVKACGDC